MLFDKLMDVLNDVYDWFEEDAKRMAIPLAIALVLLACLGLYFVGDNARHRARMAEIELEISQTRREVSLVQQARERVDIEIKKAKYAIRERFNLFDRPAPQTQTFEEMVEEARRQYNSPENRARRDRESGRMTGADGRETFACPDCGGDVRECHGGALFDGHCRRKSVRPENMVRPDGVEAPKSEYVPDPYTIKDCVLHVKFDVSDAEADSLLASLPVAWGVRVFNRYVSGNPTGVYLSATVPLEYMLPELLPSYGAIRAAERPAK